MSNLSGLKNSFRHLNHPLYLAIAAGIIGRLAWSGHVNALPLSLLMMALIPFALSRSSRWLMFTAYYAGSTWPIVPGSALFYGHHFNPLFMVPLWIAVAFCLAAPWAVFCYGKGAHFGWQITLCFLIESVPPFAMFGLANPLISAGALFPTFGVLGLLLAIALAVVLAIRPRGGLIFATLSLLMATAFERSTTLAAPQGWAAVNTDFSGAGVDTPDIVEQYNVAQSIQHSALDSQANVIVFPESVVYRWNPATDLFWEETITQLRKSGKTIIVGAVLDLSGRNRYLNVAVVRGDTTNAFQQRVPMPVSLWKPFTGHGVPLNLYGPGTLTIHGQRATILICYEQLLVWPMIRSVKEHPTVLVGMANEYWAKGTDAEAIQASTLQAWGQLFNIPVISAVNR